jgi:hypothetical protein
MDAAQRERAARSQQHAREFARRYAELATRVNATLAGATHALARARALCESPHSVSRRALRPPPAALELPGERRAWWRWGMGQVTCSNCGRPAPAHHARRCQPCHIYWQQWKRERPVQGRDRRCVDCGQPPGRRSRVRCLACFEARGRRVGWLPSPPGS